MGNFFGGMLNDVIAPSINRATGGSNLGTIGANVIGNNLFKPGQGGQGGPAIEYGIDVPGYDARLDQDYPDYYPGYQQPPQYQQPLPQQDNQQYYQQMRKSIDGMNEAFSQIEKMQMPGGQYQGGGGNAGGKTGKGTANF